MDGRALHPGGTLAGGVIRDAKAGASPLALPQSQNHITTAIFVLAWGLLTAAAGFGWLGESRDYTEYLRYYFSIPQQLSFEDTRFEPGFHLFAWMFRNAGLSYDNLVLFLAGVALAIKMYLFKRYSYYPLLALATYVILFYPTQEYTQIRAAVGLAFGYFAIHKFLEERYAKGGFLLVAALLFHTSAILLALTYVASRYVRGNFATIVIAGGAALVFILSEPLRNFVVDVFSDYNPLLRSYVENIQYGETLRLYSINNLILAAAVASAVLLGWFNFGRYHATFLTMAIASLAVLAFFVDSPVVGQRSKEVLFVAAIFLMYRSPISERTWLPMVLLGADALLLGYLGIREGLIEL